MADSTDTTTTVTTMADLSLSLDDVQSLVAQFKNSDSDCSGFLDQDEVMNMLAKNEKTEDVPQEKVLKWMKKADVNADGKVCIEEFFVHFGYENTVSTIRRVFAQADTNGDGTIDIEELKAVFKTLDSSFDDETLADLHQMFDWNQDGKLSLDEFIDFLFWVR
eukprot:TRINITY_DN44011_c0_g1_i1.p1 TRINITY_DN44011_c0_g1~~TRINITY_DN44011_c0_g1_i1.p1  ORF type:complete len:163 (+),score=51.86 TRINITY_DN44011_c0_g1_i1:119-607(+)